jgi:hypothetical protein
LVILPLWRFGFGARSVTINFGICARPEAELVYKPHRLEVEAVQLREQQESDEREESASSAVYKQRKSSPDST